MEHPLIPVKSVTINRQALPIPDNDNRLDASYNGFFHVMRSKVRSVRSALGGIRKRKSYSADTETCTTDMSSTAVGNNEGSERFDRRAAPMKFKGATHQAHNPTRRRSLGDLFGLVRFRSQNFLHEAKEPHIEQANHFEDVQRFTKPELLVIEPFKPLEVDLKGGSSTFCSIDALEKPKAPHLKESQLKTENPSALQEQAHGLSQQTQRQIIAPELPKYVVCYAPDSNPEKEKDRLKRCWNQISCSPVPSISERLADGDNTSRPIGSSVVSRFALDAGSIEDNDDSNDSRVEVPIVSMDDPDVSSQASVLSRTTTIDDTSSKTTNISDTPVKKHATASPQIGCMSQDYSVKIDTAREGMATRRDAPCSRCKHAWFGSSTNPYYADLPDSDIDATRTSGNMVEYILVDNEALMSAARPRESDSGLVDDCSLAPTMKTEAETKDNTVMVNDCNQRDNVVVCAESMPIGQENDAHKSTKDAACAHDLRCGEPIPAAKDYDIWDEIHKDIMETTGLVAIPNPRPCRIFPRTIAVGKSSQVGACSENKKVDCHDQGDNSPRSSHFQDPRDAEVRFVYDWESPPEKSQKSYDTVQEDKNMALQDPESYLFRKMEKKLGQQLSVRRYF